jgi:hypothetical protein
MSLLTFIPPFGRSATLVLTTRTLIINECKSRLQYASRLCKSDSKARTSLVYDYTREVVANAMDLCR